MRIVSSEMLFSSQHKLVEEHTRQEGLVAGVSSSGAWEPGVLQDGTVRTREQEIDPSQPSLGEPPLLDQYLDGASLDSLRARIDAPETAGRPGARTAGLARARLGLDGLAGDLELLARLTDEARRVAGREASTRQATGAGAGGLDLARLERATAAGMPLPDLEILRQGLTALGSGERADLLTQLFQVALPDPVEALAPLSTAPDSEDQLNMDLIRAAVEAFSGRSLRILSPSDLNLDKGAPVYTPGTAAAGPTEAESAPEGAAEEPTFGLRYHYRETHYERETTTFQAEGVVRTADGQEIDIDVSLTMGRQFASEESMEVQIGGALQDPLVVNFQGTAAELTERTYQFDLDTDGEAEQIHFVGPNSGFLALDRDGSGTIEDGSELFGARTGNGFAELAAYDEDGNQFIDEADSVYEGLRVWQKDGAGNDRLVALGQSGVGAIYLGHTDTPFQVKDDDNQLQGVIRSSGVYVKEDGGTGTVQQLDLVV
ncbi:hypothetical protein ACFL6X_01425 [Candidatus Latescibacterota bacterium]